MLKYILIIALLLQGCGNYIQVRDNDCDINCQKYILSNIEDWQIITIVPSDPKWGKWDLIYFDNKKSDIRQIELNNYAIEEIFTTRHWTERLITRP